MINWRPGIGDPTFAGWLTTVCYFAAAVLCGLAASRVRSATDGRGGSAAFWVILTILLAALGINKQLDLQSLFTELARALARQQGWYEQRQSAQKIFIALVGLCGALALTFFAILIRRSLETQGLALLGVILLACFVLIRASSFHHVDSLLGLRLAGLKLNWIIELTGIACVGICAGSSLRRRKTAPAS